MGLEGLRNRVRIVASQVAKTAKGKENIKSPVAEAKTEKVEVLPPPVGNEIPRTPNIPRGKVYQLQTEVEVLHRDDTSGKQIPRTPPLSGEESNASLSNVSADSITMDIKKFRNPQRPRLRITTADFDSPLECRVEEAGGRFESRDMLARTPLCPAPPDLSLPPPPQSLLEPTPPPVQGQRPAGVYQLQPGHDHGEEEGQGQEEEARVEAQQLELTEALRKKKLLELELKKKNVELEKVKKENLKFADGLERSEKIKKVEIEKARKENKVLSDNIQKVKFELETLQKRTKDLDLENKDLKEKNNKLRSDLMSSRNSEKFSEAKNLELNKKMNEMEKLNEDLKRKIAEIERKSNDDKICEDVVPLKKTEKTPPVLNPEKAPAESVPDSAEVKSSPEENDVQESSISSSCSDKLPGDSERVLEGKKSSEVEHNLQEKETRSLSTTPVEPAIVSKSVDDSSMESDRRKRLLKEAMRANVEKRQQRMKNTLEKTDQIKEDAKARREKFEENQQKKRASLVPRTNISENPLRVGRRQTSIPAGPSQDPESRPSESVSPTKKIKLADKVSVPKGRSKALAEEPTTAVDGGADVDVDVDESPLFYPPPVGRKQKDQAEKVHSPVTSKSDLTKTRKRKTEKDESPHPQLSEADQTETKSPPKKGKRSVKKTKATEKAQVDVAEGGNSPVEKEAEKPRRGRKPKVKPEVGKEVQAEPVKKVVEEPLTSPDTEVRSRPRRDCKKRFESLTFSSNPNSPAVPANQNPVEEVEVKKQRRPNKKSNVLQPHDENLKNLEEPQPEVVDKPKAAPSKRGRKPGGKKTNLDKAPAEADPIKAIPEEVRSFWSYELNLTFIKTIFRRVPLESFHRR